MPHPVQCGVKPKVNVVIVVRPLFRLQVSFSVTGFPSRLQEIMPMVESCLSVKTRLKLPKDSNISLKNSEAVGMRTRGMSLLSGPGNRLTLEVW